MSAPVKDKKARPSQNVSPKSKLRYFLFEKEQKKEILLLGVAGVLVHLLLLYLFPTPKACADTFHYLVAASNHDLSVYRPYGYSAALIFLNGFSEGTYIVFLAQYFLHFVSSLFFLYTIKYLFRPHGGVERLLFILFSILTLFSPAVLYLSNYVISDSLFISLTILWVTTLIWVLYNGSLPNALLHMVVLFALIQVRYTGLFYPVFSVCALVYVYRKKLPVALASIPLLILWYTYSHSKSGMMRLYKTDTFSAFSGWQTANNTFHIVPYIDLKIGNIRNPELKRIHLAALETPDSVYKSYGITDIYMWDATKPGKKYFIRYLEEHEGDYLISWARASVYLNDYGKLLMIKYPVEYLQHFLLPNARLVFWPKWTEMLEQSELIKDKNDGWFTLNEADTKDQKPDIFKNYYFPFMPVLTFILWLLLAFSLVLFALRIKKHPVSKQQKSVILFMIGFLLTYIAFHIFAAPVAVRYILGIHAIQLALIYIVVLFSIQKPAASN